MKYHNTHILIQTKFQHWEHTNNSTSLIHILEKVENSSYHVSHILACTARHSSAHQSILLIKEMRFDYLIAIVSLKNAEIGMSEVTENERFCPPHFPQWTSDNTARSEQSLYQRGRVVRMFSMLKFGLNKNVGVVVFHSLYNLLSKSLNCLSDNLIISHIMICDFWHLCNCSGNVTVTIKRLCINWGDFGYNQFGRVSYICLFVSFQDHLSI